MKHLWIVSVERNRELTKNFMRNWTIAENMKSRRKWREIKSTSNTLEISQILHIFVHFVRNILIWICEFDQFKFKCEKLQISCLVPRKNKNNLLALKYSDKCRESCFFEYNRIRIEARIHYAPFNEILRSKLWEIPSCQPRVWRIVYSNFVRRVEIPRKVTVFAIVELSLFENRLRLLMKTRTFRINSSSSSFFFSPLACRGNCQQQARQLLINCWIVASGRSCRYNPLIKTQSSPFATNFPAEFPSLAISAIMSSEFSTVCVSRSMWRKKS